MSFAAELLTFPDLFPVRHSGERWGGERLGLAFAGGPYHLRGLSKRQRRGLEERYGALCLDGAVPDDALEIEVFRAPDSDFRELEPAPWRDYPMELDPAARAVRIASPAANARTVIFCPFSMSPRRSRISWSKSPMCSF